MIESGLDKWTTEGLMNRSCLLSQ